MTRLRFLLLAGALVSVGLYVSLFLTLVLIFSLNYWLGWATTVTAIAYKGREAILKAIIDEAGTS